MLQTARLRKRKKITGIKLTRVRDVNTKRQLGWCLLGFKHRGHIALEIPAERWLTRLVIAPLWLGTLGPLWVIGVPPIQWCHCNSGQFNWLWKNTWLHYYAEFWFTSTYCHLKHILYHLSYTENAVSPLTAKAGSIQWGIVWMHSFNWQQECSPHLVFRHIHHPKQESILAAIFTRGSKMWLVLICPSGKRRPHTPRNFTANVIHWFAVSHMAVHAGPKVTPADWVTKEVRFPAAPSNSPHGCLPLATMC